MARRKDHTPEQLKELISSAAKKLIYSNGLDGFTARALAHEIGYAPGTIYNFYKDMDALVVEINYDTLGRLFELCQTRVKQLPPDISKVKALAYAYVDFAHENTRAWETVFAANRKGGKRKKLPKYYQARLLDLFALIERTLRECLNLSDAAARSSARLLWACLHGITILTLDGRLNLVGVQKPHDMIDDLLQKYLQSPRASAFPYTGSS